MHHHVKQKKNIHRRFRHSKEFQEIKHFFNEREIEKMFDEFLKNFHKEGRKARQAREEALYEFFKFFREFLKALHKTVEVLPGSCVIA